MVKRSFRDACLYRGIPPKTRKYDNAPPLLSPTHPDSNDVVNFEMLPRKGEQEDLIRESDDQETQKRQEAMNAISSESFSFSTKLILKSLAGKEAVKIKNSGNSGGNQIRSLVFAKNTALPEDLVLLSTSTGTISAIRHPKLSTSQRQDWRFSNSTGNGRDASFSQSYFLDTDPSRNQLSAVSFGGSCGLPEMKIFDIATKQCVRSYDDTGLSFAGKPSYSLDGQFIASKCNGNIMAFFDARMSRPAEKIQCQYDFQSEEKPAFVSNQYIVCAYKYGAVCYDIRKVTSSCTVIDQSGGKNENDDIFNPLRPSKSAKQKRETKVKQPLNPLSSCQHEGADETDIIRSVKKKKTSGVNWGWGWGYNWKKYNPPPSGQRAAHAEVDDGSMRTNSKCELVTCENQNSSSAFDPFLRRYVPQFTGHKVACTKVLLDESGQRLFTYDPTGVAKMWNLPMKKGIHTFFHPFKNTIGDIVLTNSCDALLMLANSRMIVAWSVYGQKFYSADGEIGNHCCGLEPPERFSYLDTFSLSRTDTFIVLGKDDGTISFSSPLFR
eukprot:Nk52_evm3s128 gene=Nk52_evmTU3s128